MLKVIVLLSIVALSCADYVKVDPSDEDVVVAANVAGKALSKQFSGKFHHKLAKIVEARKSNNQEGGYANYIIDIIVGQTSCTKEEYAYEDLEECDFQSGISAFKKCTAVVFGNSKGEQRMAASGCSLADKKDVEGI